MGGGISILPGPGIGCCGKWLLLSVVMGRGGDCLGNGVGVCGWGGDAGVGMGKGKGCEVLLGMGTGKSWWVCAVLFGIGKICSGR